MGEDQRYINVKKSRPLKQKRLGYEHSMDINILSHIRDEF